MGDLYPHDSQVGRIDPTKADYKDHVHPTTAQRITRWAFEKFHPQFKNERLPMEDASENWYPAAAAAKPPQEWEMDFRTGLTSDHPTEIIPVDSELEHARYHTYPLGAVMTTPMHAHPFYVVNDDNYMDPQSGLRVWHIKRMRREYIGVCPPALYEGIRRRVMKCFTRYPHTLVFDNENHPCTRLASLLTKCLLLRDAIWTPLRYHALSSWFEERAQFARWADVGLAELGTSWMWSINRDLFVPKVHQHLQNVKAVALREDVHQRMERLVHDEVLELAGRLDLTDKTQQERLNILNDLRDQVVAHRVRYFGSDYFIPVKTLMEIIEEQKANEKKVQELENQLLVLQEAKLKRMKEKELLRIRDLRASTSDQPTSQATAPAPEPEQTASQKLAKFELYDMYPALHPTKKSRAKMLATNRRLKKIHKLIQLNDPGAWEESKAARRRQVNAASLVRMVDDFIAEHQLPPLPDDEPPPATDFDFSSFTLDELTAEVRKATEQVENEIDLLQRKKASLLQTYSGPLPLDPPLDLGPALDDAQVLARLEETALSQTEKREAFKVYKKVLHKRLDRLNDTRKLFISMLPQRVVSRTTAAVHQRLDAAMTKQGQMEQQMRHERLREFGEMTEKLVLRRKRHLIELYRRALIAHKHYFIRTREGNGPKLPPLPPFEEQADFPNTLRDLELRVQSLRDEWFRLNNTFDTMLQQREYETPLETEYISPEFDYYRLNPTRHPIPPPTTHEIDMRADLLTQRGNIPSYDFNLSRTTEMRIALAWFRFQTNEQTKLTGSFDFDAMHDNAMRYEAKRLASGLAPTNIPGPLAPWEAKPHPADFYKEDVDRMLADGNTAVTRNKLMDKLGKSVVSAITEPIWPQFAQEWKNRMKSLLNEDGGFELEGYGTQREYYMAELGRRRASWELPEIPGREVHPFGWPGQGVSKEEILADALKTRYARVQGFLDPHPFFDKLQRGEELNPIVFGKDNHELVKPQWKPHDFSDQRVGMPGWALEHPGIDRVYKFSREYEDPFLRPVDFNLASDWTPFQQDKSPTYWNPSYHPQKTEAVFQHGSDSANFGPSSYVQGYTEQRELGERLQALSKTIPTEEPYMPLSRQRELRERAMRAQQARSRESSVSDPTIPGRI